MSGRRVKTIHSASVAPMDTGRGTIRMVGAPGQPLAPTPPPPAPTNFAPMTPTETPDDQWEAEVKRRELTAGIPAAAVPGGSAGTLARIHEQSGGLDGVMDDPRGRPVLDHHADEPAALVDLSALPDKFNLQVERKKNGWWKVTAPEVHTGLFLSHQDLLRALAAAPITLAQIVQIDGTLPLDKRKRRSKAATHG